MKATENIFNLRKGEGINPKKEPLTAEKLKTFKGYSHLSDKEAELLVIEIKTLAALIMEFQNLKANQQDDNNEPLKQAA